MITEIDELSVKLESISKELTEAKLTLNETIKKFHTTRVSFDEELIKNVQTLRYRHGIDLSSVMNWTFLGYSFLILIPVLVTNFWLRTR